MYSKCYYTYSQTPCCSQSRYMVRVSAWVYKKLPDATSCIFDIFKQFLQKKRKIKPYNSKVLSATIIVPCAENLGYVPIIQYISHGIVYVPVHYIDVSREKLGSCISGKSKKHPIIHIQVLPIRIFTHLLEKLFIICS